MPSSLLVASIGARFGRLVVVGEPFKRDGKGRHRVLCKCDCGNEATPLCLSLAQNNTTSCGCLHKEQLSARSKTHGMSKSPTYETYLNMVNRCTDPKNKKYADYGGRGIKVCERWLESFENFLADMGVRPDGMTLDRYPDVNGNYEPNNCKWATWKEQQNNKRSNHRIEFDGETLTLQQWSDRTGISHSTIWNRLRAGWSLEKIMTTQPVIGRNQFST